MKQITIKLDDGTEVVAQVNEDELAKLTKQERTRTGYERVEDGERHYIMLFDGAFPFCIDQQNQAFNNGNYVNDERLCQDRYRARLLHDRLEQWQALNDEPVDWSNGSSSKYKICCECLYMSLFVDGNISIRDEGVVYFSNKEKAQEAIEVFRDELIWYYTEYRSRLDEPIHSNKT